MRHYFSNCPFDEGSVFALHFSNVVFFFVLGFFLLCLGLCVFYVVLFCVVELHSCALKWQIFFRQGCLEATDKSLLCFVFEVQLK